MRNFMKKVIIVFIIVLFLLLFYHFIFLKYRNKSKFEKEVIPLSQSIQHAPFSIDKVISYSSAHGKNQNTTFQKSSWILNILQYTDIAIYIHTSNNELTASNTVKTLVLENIRLSNPKRGTSSLYYLDSLNFGTPTFHEINKLENSIEFTVLNDANQNRDIQSNTPVFFTDCSNPITLKYVNPSVQENYTVTTNEPIFFDGHLLEMAHIPLEDLQTSLHFTIHLESNDNQHYFYPFTWPISLKNKEHTLYEGSLLEEKTLENAKFITEF